MNSISSILARKGTDTISVSPNTTVLDALRIMAEKNIGSVMVIYDGNFVGVVSERDYSRKVILKGKHSHDTLVSEIMSSELPTVTPKDSVEHCMSLMTKNAIRYVPVFENGKLAGIISMSDVVKETILSQKETINQLENYIHGQG
ncbi:CBS domain-containing protein [Terrimonas sp. NA20]|uniref:CBS domain-containing protein n=1 Tax=Terrimonas ginsenosidimutans TaxID=2908004 RepID=A0ABS9KXX3_9BACT|nr:CBS domain-containing protein [Terrimonas ginsenosidimutans]MCG2617227.1 CBS domain-containing protein [Terrimonas ginsenosidimutans]